jgi:Uma2 family endonuclease
MATTIVLTEPGLTLHNLVVRLTEEQFAEFVFNNPEVMVERDDDGLVIFHSPTGGGSGARNAELTYWLQAWNRIREGGVVFDSSTLFRLPSGAIRSPDATWIARERWESLSVDEQEGIVPLAPDFVIELRSRTDDLAALLRKMEEYRAQGVQLGLLLDPQGRQRFVFRPDVAVQGLADPGQIDGFPELPGFVLPLDRIFDGAIRA